jgi:DNA-binding transcriptional LysR family regulator
MYDWAEYRHFRYLLAVLERIGFRAAAEELHTTQPNLSAQAKTFQEQSGLHLYRKAKSGRIRLTPTGIAFKPIAKALLAARDEAMAALLAIERGEIRTLRIGCSPQADPALFHEFCAMHKELLPDCSIRPAHGDTPHLEEEIAAGDLDAAIVTLPVVNPHLYVDEIRRDRLVVCLRADHPLAANTSIQPTDLQAHLTVLYHPQRHPSAHARLFELLGDKGVKVDEYSRASHPTEMQTLVKLGYGFALIREGTPLDAELTTRPVAGVDWTVGTAFVYRKHHHHSTIPVLIRHLKSRIAASGSPTQSVTGKRPPRSVGDGPEQMSLLG